MHGVWAISDALLGLMSWRSTLVQLELCQLFDAPPENWFNRKFVDEIQTRFDEKLESMVETLQLVHNPLHIFLLQKSVYNVSSYKYCCVAHQASSFAMWTVHNPNAVLVLAEETEEMNR
ncbi:hypothetical protein L873DRAFT_1795926 [Choiromyces venosus 120613-1]|uniref:Uncharacterized protein n=1 Tax=Choiromyces venosus 120613-1 TaxID=1336337 RepID=A0A3N4IU64_9PEZI|nr:hypothetical protein L873DRAFT_1795926 [Choiromyces venosus 120613-1]